MSGEKDWIGHRIELYQALKLFPNWSNRRLGLLLKHSPQWVGKWRKRWDTANSIQPSDFAGKSRRPKRCLTTKTGKDLQIDVQK
jgi:hypothetical protein